MVTIRIEFDEPGASEQAWAFAQFLKRLRWNEYRACAIDDDEAYAIRDAVAKVQQAFTLEGYNPR